MKFISTIHKLNLKASADDLDLALAYVVPEGNPKGLVQIVHGMCGHKERSILSWNILPLMVMFV